jgi:4-hydroxybenzoate polyprenyltransferase
LPNVPTAVANVAMGLLFVQAVSTPADVCVLGLLAASVSLLYAAGSVLNDVFDFEIDVHQRPERPLPSGRVSRPGAARFGWALLVGGTILGMAVAVVVGQPRPAIVVALLAGCIVLYDTGLKRTLLGPVAMGCCRMLGVLLGMSTAVTPWRAEHWLVAGAIGVYVLGITVLARTESEQTDRRRVAGAIGILILGIAMLGCLPWVSQTDIWSGQWVLIVTLLGVLIARQSLRPVFDPSPRRIQAAVKLGILSLVVLDAAVCLAVRGPTAAVAVLLLLAPAVVLGRWFRST